MKVLIADKFEPFGLEKLEEIGCEVLFEPSLTVENLPEGVVRHDPDVLIVRSTKVRAEAISAGQRLSLIVRAGAGVDNIDLPAASERGIFVANCPGKNAIAVAELAFALLASCDRRIPDATADLRAGLWRKGEYGKARGLHGRTLGVAGTGDIAQEFISRARAFGMQVVAYSRSLTDEKAAMCGALRASSLLDLARRSDAVSIHVSANEQTKGLFGEEFFDALKPGAYVINTSRGSVMDYDALARAVEEKGIRVGLDVFPDEPGKPEAPFADELIGKRGVCGTPHVGASTGQAQTAIALEAVRIVERHRRSGSVPNVVNLNLNVSTSKNLLSVRHLNRPGVLAHVFRVLSEANVNVAEMENLIYAGGMAACARIYLDQPVDGKVVSMIQNGRGEILSTSVVNAAD